MLPPLDQFQANIRQVQSLVSLAAVLDSQTTAVVDVGDIYRASIVLTISALDHYVHEKTLASMLEISEGLRPPTDAFGRFQVGLAILGPTLTAPPSGWLESEIRRAHGVLTFQRAEAIADAMRLIHPEPLWIALAPRFGFSAKDAKDTLNLLVDRRNKIAHEADCEPNGLGIKWPITSDMVNETIVYVIKVVGAIEATV